MPFLFLGIVVVVSVVVVVVLVVIVVIVVIVAYAIIKLKRECVEKCSFVLFVEFQASDEQLEKQPAEPLEGSHDAFH